MDDMMGTHQTLRNPLVNSIGTASCPGKDDEKALYDLLGNKDERKKFDTQFKKAESNFKIAIKGVRQRNGASSAN